MEKKKVTFYISKVSFLFWYSLTPLSLNLQIQQRYKDATGFMPYIFEGSSPGAGKFGYLKIRRRSPANPS